MSDTGDPGTHEDVTAARSRVEEVREKGTLPPAYLDFRLAVLERCRRLLPEGETITAPETGSQQERETRAREGKVFLDAGEVAGRAGTLLGVLRDVADLMKEAGLEGAEGLIGRVSGPEAEAEAATLSRAVLERDREILAKKAEEVGMRPGLLRFAVSSSLFPLLAPARQALADSVVQRLWMRGHCPVCGSEPDMARLDKGSEGARMLHCAACGMEWRFSRVTCPFCANNEPATMRLFFADTEAPRRLEACGKCKRYVKEVDERKLVEGTTVNLAAEEMATLDLDLAAEAEGYGN